jgi:PKD repeat protein
VAVLGEVGLFSSLVLDEQGYGHISCWHYSDYYNSSLDYAYQDAGGWHVVLGVDSGQVGRYTSLALDDSGYPHISYHASRSGALWNTLAYAYWNGTSWTKQNVDYGGDEPVGAYTSLALDGDDYPHISYFDYSNSALKYAYKDGSGWHKQTLDNDGEVGRYTSLALDESGYPRISYHDTSGGDLKYAYYAGPPVAAFTASPTSGPRPLTVVFTDTSTGAVDTWLWSFGDGVTSTLWNPTHTYTATGVYTVALIVSGPGGSDSVTHTNYINVRNPIPAQADFTANPATGVRPLTVVFTNASTGDYSISLWDFGDGVTSTIESPIHTYTTVGAYTVTLAVSGLGGSDSITRTNYITVTPIPVQAAFTAAPTSGLIPLMVVFTNTSTGDYSTSLWDFGDSVTSTLESLPHIYTTTGAYTVSLTVSGPGGSDAETKVDYITVLNEYKIYLPLILRLYVTS